MPGIATRQRPLPLPLRVIDRISLILALAAAAGLILLALFVFVDVTGRTLFHRPLTGALEMTAQWWMPILTLLAMGFTERRQEHIKVTILLDALPERLRRNVEGVFGLVAAALVAALAWYSLTEALHSAALGRSTPSTPPVAVWPFEFTAPIGLAALALQLIATSWRWFADIGRHPDRHDGEEDLL